MEDYMKKTSKHEKKKAKTSYNRYYMKQPKTANSLNRKFGIFPAPAITPFFLTPLSL